SLRGGAPPESGWNAPLPREPTSRPRVRCARERPLGQRQREHLGRPVLSRIVAYGQRSRVSLAPCFNPRFSEGHRPSHRAQQELVRKAELDVARFLQPLALLVAEAHIECAEVVLELAQGADAEDGCGDAWIEQGPGDRNLRGGPFHFPGDLFDHIGDLEAARGERTVGERNVLACAAGRGRYAPVLEVGMAVLTGEHAARERRPGNYPESHLACHRDEIALDRTLDEAVLDLQRRE